MTAHNPYNQTLLLILTCLNVCVLNGARADAPVQTSLQQAANVTTTAYVQSGRAQKDKEKLDELLTAMMLAGMLPDAPAGESDLGDPDAEDNDQNANRRNQRDRRRRNDQRRRNNRNRQQRNNDNNRSRTRYNRNQRRTDDAPPTGPVA